jgi:hypothetical protein
VAAGADLARRLHAAHGRSGSVDAAYVMVLCSACAWASCSAYRGRTSTSTKESDDRMATPPARRSLACREQDRRGGHGARGAAIEPHPAQHPRRPCAGHGGSRQSAWDDAGRGSEPPQRPSGRSANLSGAAVCGPAWWCCALRSRCAGLQVD